MACSSFVVGYDKVLAEKEPRFLVLTGNEYGLKEKVLDAIKLRNANSTDSCSSISVVAAEPKEVFRASLRPGTTRTILLHGANEASSWDWLPIWFNKAKGIRIVVTDASPLLADKLIVRANTRGYGINCSAPSTHPGQARLVKLFGQWYGQSHTQINVLLNQSNWRITECMQLLEKLKVLNLTLTSDTLAQVGLVQPASKEFVTALANDNASVAMTVIPRLSPDEYAAVLAELSHWLDTLARVKGSQGYMKSANDIAFEVGQNRKVVEIVQRQGHRFTLERVNKIALALALADKAVTNGHRNGVLEVLLSVW